MIFQPTVMCSDSQSKQCQNRISQLGKMRSYELSTYISVYVEGFRWWGYILAPEWKPNLQGS